MKLRVGPRRSSMVTVWLSAAAKCHYYLFVHRWVVGNVFDREFAEVRTKPPLWYCGPAIKVGSEDPAATNTRVDMLSFAKALQRMERVLEEQVHCLLGLRERFALGLAADRATALEKPVALGGKGELPAST